MHDAEAITAKYGQWKTGFLTTFSTDKKNLFLSITLACECITPTLADIDKAYGEGSAVMWLAGFIVETAMYTGVREFFTDYQSEMCALGLYQMAKHYSVSEMMSFFARFQLGFYETFLGYSHPNPAVITRSFRQFLVDYEPIKEQVENSYKAEQHLKQRAEWEKNKAPCPESLAEKLKEVTKKFNWRERSANHKGRIIK